MHKERMQSMVLQKEPILYIKQLSKQHGERVILRDITMNIYPCEVVSLIGASGSGKSTLLRCINQIETREETKCLVLRMRAVPAVDSTAMNSMVALYERCQKNGVTLILSHVNEQPMHVMEKAGFVDMIGRDHFCPNIEAALDHADEMLGK